MTNEELRIKLASALLKEIGVTQDEINQAIVSPGMNETIKTATCENLYYMLLWRVNRNLKTKDCPK